MDWGSILILAVVALAAAAAFRYIRRHPGQCSGNCGSCQAHCPHRRDE